jgi:hypothetical protein
VRSAIIGAIATLLAAAPAASRAQIGADGGAPHGAGTVRAAPDAPVGGVAGPSFGSTRPYYRDYAYRDRMCWHDRGYRHCRWR